MARNPGFPHLHWRAISTKEWSEDDTLTGFFSQAPGYTIEATYDQETSWEIAGMPQVAAQDGSVLHGVLAHVNAANLTPNACSIVYERVDGGSYEPLSGDLEVTVSRQGRTH